MRHDGHNSTVVVGRVREFVLPLPSVDLVLVIADLGEWVIDPEGAEQELMIVESTTHSSCATRPIAAANRLRSVMPRRMPRDHLARGGTRLRATAAHRVRGAARRSTPLANLTG